MELPGSLSFGLRICRLALQKLKERRERGKKKHPTWKHWMTEHIPCELPFPRNREWECPCKPPGGSRAPSAVNIYPRGQGLDRGNSLIACWEKFEDCAILVWSWVIVWCSVAFIKLAHNKYSLSEQYKPEAECLDLHHFLNACSSRLWFVVGNLNVVVSVWF